MRTHYGILILTLFLSSCGRQETKFGSKTNLESAPDSGKKNNDSKTTVVTLPSIKRMVVINPNSTASFSPVSIDAKYADCSGALPYNVRIEGENDSSLSLQSSEIPQLQHWYTYDFDSEVAPVGPSFGTNGIEIDPANPGISVPRSTAVKFTFADSERLTFTFQIVYRNGRQLNGTVDVPLAPGRQIRCQ
jgi:hypothetical protein